MPTYNIDYLFCFLHHHVYTRVIGTESQRKAFKLRFRLTSDGSEVTRLRSELVSRLKTGVCDLKSDLSKQRRQAGVASTFRLREFSSLLAASVGGQIHGFGNVQNLSDLGIGNGSVGV